MGFGFLPFLFLARFIALKNKKMKIEEPTKYYDLSKKIGGAKMTNQIGEIAKDYKSNATKNIADLPEVSIKSEIFDDNFETIDKVTKQPKFVKQKVITVNNVNYRVPVSVLQQLKILLEDNPKLQKFKVKKSGEGLDGTRYQVIPLV